MSSQDLKPQISFFTFRIAQQWMGLELDYCQEIVNIDRLHSIPHCKNPFLRGVGPYKGKLEICLDLSFLLDAKFISSTSLKMPLHTIVLIYKEEIWMGIVDEIGETQTIDAALLRKPSESIQKKFTLPLKGEIAIKQQNIALLEGEKILEYLNQVFPLS